MPPTLLLLILVSQASHFLASDEEQYRISDFGKDHLKAENPHTHRQRPHKEQDHRLGSDARVWREGGRPRYRGPSTVQRVSTNAKPSYHCMPSHSQENEESILISEFDFERTQRGVYVEIGALDGDLHSNTLSLATCHNWTGVLIEASYENFEHLTRNVVRQGRPNSTLFFGAVCVPPQTHIPFVRGGAVGTVPGQMNEAFVKKYSRVGGYGGEVPVPCQPMSGYLSGISHVHFFSLDVEGSEMTVLETIDFTQITIDVFLVEIDPEFDIPGKGWRVEHFLANVGYLECNTIKIPRSKVFVRRDSHYIPRCRKVDSV